MSDKNEPSAAPSERLPQWADLWQSFWSLPNRWQTPGPARWPHSCSPACWSSRLDLPSAMRCPKPSRKWRRGRGLPMCGTSTGKWRWCSAHGWKCVKRLASYNAVTAAPWTEASKRFHRRDVRGNRQRQQSASELARSFREMERNFQRGTDPKPAHRWLSAGPEGTAAVGIETSQPAG